ncbi:MAG: hypothetical protein U5M53_05780 [Rhodoferax sp.]|nr:hypothetical protein [Rhodoferax sp.]
MGDTSDGPEAERFYERTTADGHLIQFGVSVKAWRDRPRYIGLVNPERAAAAYLGWPTPCVRRNAAPARRHSGRCHALWGRPVWQAH